MREILLNMILVDRKLRFCLPLSTEMGIFAMEFELTIAGYFNNGYYQTESVGEVERRRQGGGYVASLGGARGSVEVEVGGVCEPVPDGRRLEGQAERGAVHNAACESEGGAGVASGGA